MTEIIKVVSKTEYEAFQIVDDKSEALAREWLVPFGAKDAPLPDIQSARPWMIRHPDGQVAFVEAGVFLTDFDEIEGSAAELEAAIPLTEEEIAQFSQDLEEGDTP